MRKQVLYLGDTDLMGAAGYLAGVMTYYNIEFDYLSSATKMTDDIIEKDYQVVIISDYPSVNFTSSQLDRLIQKVNNGMGLAMFGGWASFVGCEGGYQHTSLAKVLPVNMLDVDDRRNRWSPCILCKNNNHQIVNSLPLSDHLPGIGGFNEFRAKQNATTVLSIELFEINRVNDSELNFVKQDTHPLLVVDSYGQGNVTCFASDVAPHWVGGLVDWGDKRIESTAKGGQTIEVGNFYAKLFNNIIEWTGRL